MVREIYLRTSAQPLTLNKEKVEMTVQTETIVEVIREVETMIVEVVVAKENLQNNLKDC
jgi:hypothetical protein